MAWTTPKTWTTGEVLTSTDMNLYLSDNLTFIKEYSEEKARQVEFNPETDSYTLVLGDAGLIVEMGKATAQTLTIPTNASVAFPIGTTITILQTGAGQVTIAPVSGTVTVNAAGSRLKLAQQWSAATIVKRAENTWVAFGDLVA